MTLDSPQKKFLVIAERIRQKIEQGTYKEGEMIPTIRELAKQYGVNPQTVNKATAHLESLGYLHSRQGAGSEVVIPEKMTRGVYMLIDRKRSRYLEELDDPRNYHGKDIYLTYLMRMSQEGRRSRFLIYDEGDGEPDEELKGSIPEVAGLLVQGTLPSKHVRLLEGAGVPTVLINRRLPRGLRGGRFASIIIGLDRLGALVDYLVTLGHRKLLYARAAEFERNGVSEERFELVRAAAESWRREYAIMVEEFVFESADPECASQLGRLVEKGFVAALAYNDNTALQLYSIVQRLGLAVGRDFSVAGFDDMNAARLAVPPLTTIRVDRGRLVREAFALLEELSRSPVPTHLDRTLETELMIRRSAFPPSRIDG